MTCITDTCTAASDCTRHVSLLLAAAGTDGRQSTAAMHAALATLADELRPLRSASPRTELLACGAHLARRFAVDLVGGPASLSPAAALATGRGAPLVLGAIAVTAARQAGIALGLLAAPHGRYAVAHATHARPEVLDLDEAFALCSVAGREPLHRWLCAHETARRVAGLHAGDGALSLAGAA